MTLSRCKNCGYMVYGETPDLCPSCKQGGLVVVDERVRKYKDRKSVLVTVLKKSVFFNILMAILVLAFIVLTSGKNIFSGSSSYILTFFALFLFILIVALLLGTGIKLFLLFVRLKGMYFIITDSTIYCNTCFDDKKWIKFKDLRVPLKNILQASAMDLSFNNQSLLTLYLKDDSVVKVLIWLKDTKESNEILDLLNPEGDYVR